MDKQLSDALALFKDHTLRETKEDRWLLCKQYPDGAWRSDFYAEIVALSNGRLFVGGDIDDCVFAYHRTKDVRQLLLWMGTSTSISYIREKATIGLTDEGLLTWVYDADIARKDLQAAFEDAADAADAEDEDLKAAYLEAQDVCDRGFDAVAAILSPYVDGCDMSHIGYVCAPRVLNAWAAVRTLCHRLKLIEGDIFNVAD